MRLLDALNTVKGAVASKELVPSFTHACFYRDRVQAFDGKLVIDAPLTDERITKALADKPQGITVPFTPLLRAVVACGVDAKVAVTDKSIMISRGGKKFRVPIATEAPMHVLLAEDDIKPQGVELTAATLKALRDVMPFVSTDASRAWSRSVLFTGEFMYATNNSVAARAGIGFVNGTQLECALPATMLDEVLRLAVPGDTIDDTDTHITVTTKKGCVIRGAQIEAQWPNVTAAFTSFHIRDEVHTLALPTGFADTVNELKPFCDDANYPLIRIDETGMHAGTGDVAGSTDAAVRPTPGVTQFHATMLALVAQQATHITLPDEPVHCAWWGGALSGLLAPTIGG